MIIRTNALPLARIRRRRAGLPRATFEFSKHHVRLLCGPVDVVLMAQAQGEHRTAGTWEVDGDVLKVLARWPEPTVDVSIQDRRLVVGSLSLPAKKVLITPPDPVRPAARQLCFAF